MRTIIQETFAPPDQVDDEALIVHRRLGKSKGILIFVHGLGGHRYGDKSTWGNFPAFVFEDIPQLDVGLYEYRTLFRRLKIWKSVSLKTEAGVLADIIRDDLSSYDSIILVGHSMGGLLCKAAIMHLLKTNERAALSRICGLFLMATPQLGSLRVLPFLSWISSDFWALRAHGDFVDEINNSFEDNVCLDERASIVEQIIIPTWAVLGAADFWVDKLSAGIGLVSSRKKTIRGSHRSVVKPKNKESSAYSWVQKRLLICLNRFTYDVFLSSAMAGLKTEEDYQRYRAEALEIEETLKNECGFRSIFYAGRNLESKKEFDAQSISLTDDFRALKESRLFLLVYPERVVSSVLFEAGWALALSKPSVYYVRKRDDLPFLMGQAGDAVGSRVTIHEYGTRERRELIRLIERHKERLWEAV